jgi:hypothetical protein
MELDYSGSTFMHWLVSYPRVFPKALRKNNSNTITGVAA